MRAAERRYRSVVADSARWDGFEFRPDDIVISTPPKCGTTWTQMLCALLIFQDPDLPRPLTELSPWMDMQTQKLEDVRADLDAQEHRRFIKTHTPLDGIPYDERVTYICVGRDPRDVAVSWDHHMGNLNLPNFIAARAEAVGLEDLNELMPEGVPYRPPDERERFWLWIDDDTIDSAPSGLGFLLHHLATFWERRHLPNVHLFHYADLQADLEGETRRLASALGIDIDDAQISELVEAARFERMRERASELAPAIHVEGFWNDTTSFFHRGTSGQWESFVTSSDDQARYEARVAALAPPDLAAWVHAGRSALAHT